MDMKKWDDALARHAAAVAGYVATAAKIDDAAWREPVEEGKWSPAEITHHLVLAYEAVVREITGGAGLRVQTGWLLRLFLRPTFLRPILKTRKLPRGAKAPRSLLPDVGDMSREEALERLRSVAGEFEREIDARRDRKDLRLTHHVFGAIKPLEGIDFVAIHTEHHCRQLPGAAAVE